MSLDSAFQRATVADVSALHGLNLESGKNYLWAGVFDVTDKAPATSNTKNYVVVEYDGETSVDEAMTKIARWIKDSDAFNQYATHKEKWEEYAIRVYDLPHKQEIWTGVNSQFADNQEHHPDLIGDVRLSDYLLPYGQSRQTVNDIKDYPHFMDILDRDRVTFQIKSSVETILQAEETLHPSYSGKGYENDIRQASHPYPQRVSVIEIPKFIL